MSMSTYLRGFRPPDEKFHRMRAALKACRSADVVPPKEVSDFFEGADDEEIDDEGVTVCLDTNMPGVSEYHGDCQEGIQVNLDELDKSIRVLRFINGW